MSILYLDTSALVKLYVNEAGSVDMRSLVQTCDHAGTSLIARAEMAAALSRARRLNILSVKEAGTAWESFLKDWVSLSRLGLSKQVIERASEAAWDYSLRGYDAVHFASIMLWREVLEAEVILVTFDRELWTAGQQASLLLWPQSPPGR